MKHTIRNIFQIYTSDIHNILTNWVVAVIIGGLIFTFSLCLAQYLCIYGSLCSYIQHEDCYCQ